MTAFAEIQVAAALFRWREKQRYTRAQAVEALSLLVGYPVSLRTYEGWEQGRSSPRGLAKAALLRAIS